MRVAMPGVLFVLVMAQPNLATGMMPLYRSMWGLAPLLVTVVFAAYLLALVPTWPCWDGPPTAPGGGWRIAVGVVAGVAADIVMSFADSATVACVARVAAGVSVGLVTGSVSGLVLERAGDRGRTTMATATVLGSALGTVAAAVCAQCLPPRRSSSIWSTPDCSPPRESASSSTVPHSPRRPTPQPPWCRRHGPRRTALPGR